MSKGNFNNKGWPKGKKRDKPTTKANRDAREQIIKKIYKHKDDLIKAQIESAKGIYYLDPEKGIVYQRKPNTTTGEYLLNQLIGKPKEHMEVTGEVELKIDL